MNSLISWGKLVEAAESSARILEFANVSENPKSSIGEIRSKTEVETRIEHAAVPALTHLPEKPSVPSCEGISLVGLTQ